MNCIQPRAPAEEGPWLAPKPVSISLIAARIDGSGGAEPVLLRGRAGRWGSGRREPRSGRRTAAAGNGGGATSSSGSFAPFSWSGLLLLVGLRVLLASALRRAPAWIAASASSAASAADTTAGSWVRAGGAVVGGGGGSGGVWAPAPWAAIAAPTRVAATVCEAVPSASTSATRQPSPSLRRVSRSSLAACSRSSETLATISSPSRSRARRSAPRPGAPRCRRKPRRVVGERLGERRPATRRNVGVVSSTFPTSYGRKLSEGQAIWREARRPRRRGAGRDGLAATGAEFVGLEVGVRRPAGSMAGSPVACGGDRAGCGAAAATDRRARRAMRPRARPDRAQRGGGARSRSGSRARSRRAVRKRPEELRLDQRAGRRLDRSQGAPPHAGPRRVGGGQSTLLEVPGGLAELQPSFGGSLQLSCVAVSGLGI